MGIAIAGQIPTGIAIAGQVPSGVAVQGQVIWRSIEWQLLSYATANRGLSGVSLSTSLNTTGANLLVVVTGYYQGTLAFTDSQGNVWIEGISNIDSATFACRLFYCVNPITSTVHTVSVSGGNYLSLIFLAFITSPSIVSDQTSTAYVFDTTTSTTSIQLNPLTPSANSNLILAAMATSGGSILAIDSDFQLLANMPFVGATYQGVGVASLTQDIAATVAPTWTTSPSSRLAAVGISFIPA